MSRPTALLLRPDRAGDALKSLAPLRALRALLPEWDLLVLASEHNASLFAMEPRISLRVLPRAWQKMAPEAWLSEMKFPEMLRKTVSLLCDPSEDIDLLLRNIPSLYKYSAALVSQELFVQSQITRLDLPDHTPAGRSESLNIALLLEKAFEVPVSEQFEKHSQSPLHSEHDDLEAVEKMGAKRGRWLGLCPFAGLAHRTPPLTRWERFFPRATALGKFDRYFIFGTPSDYAKMDRLRRISGVSDQVELCFPSSFRALGSYLRRLDAVTAVDSGPLHLARAQGVPALGVLSGGDADRWFHPLAPGDLLIRRGFFGRFPSHREMIRAFKKWDPTPLTPSEVPRLPLLRGLY